MVVSLTRIEYTLDGGMGFHEAGHGQGVLLVLHHSQLQCFGTTVGKVTVEGTGDNTYGCLLQRTNEKAFIIIKVTATKRGKNAFNAKFRHGNRVHNTQHPLTRQVTSLIYIIYIDLT